MTVRTRLWKLVWLLTGGVLLPRAAVAQRENATGRKHIIVANLSNYDARWFHPGFYIAGNLSRYVPEYTRAYVQNADVRLVTKVRPGFTVGFIGDVRLNDFMTLRFVPGVGFYTREVELHSTGAVRDTTQQIGNTSLELPLLLKYHSKRRRNVRLYLVGGIKPAIDVGNKKKDRLPGQMRAASSDLSIEYGIGADLFYPIFKFGPELRFSHGLWNLQTNDPNFFNQSMGRFGTHTVTLFLNFE